VELLTQAIFMVVAIIVNYFVKTEMLGQIKISINILKTANLEIKMVRSSEVKCYAFIINCFSIKFHGDEKHLFYLKH
jgi:hypothetical protein